MRPQEGLFHAPGHFSALVIWRLERASALPHLRDATALLLAELDTQRELHTLLALAPGLVSPGAEAGPPLLPRRGAQARFPSTQAALLLQLSAPTREPLLWALRRAAAHFRGVLHPDEELLGGRIGDGREPFGFRDGLRAPTPDEVRRTALVASGPLAGAAWLLYLRFQQDLARFSRLAPRAQARVVGRTPEGALVPDLPPDAHVARARAAGAGEASAFIRRGFPFRHAGEEGLAFVAASADPTRFHRALDALLGAPDAAPDALLRYATPVGGGLYLAPPRDWFQPHPQQGAVP